MKCIKYEVQVTEGSLAAAHSFYESIVEIFIPKYNICINEKGFAFKSKAPRLIHKKSKTKKINISEDAIEQIERYLTLKEKSETIVKQIFDGNYEERELVELDLDYETIYKITTLADQENKTFNEKINDILEQSTKDYEKNPKKFLKEMENLNAKS